MKTIRWSGLLLAMFIIAFTPSAVAQIVEYAPGDIPAHNIVSTVTIFDSTGSNLDGGIQYSVNGSPVGTFSGLNFESGQSYLWSVRYDGSLVIEAGPYWISLSPVLTAGNTLMSGGSSSGGSIATELLGVNGLVVNHSINSTGGSQSDYLWNSGSLPGSQSGTFRFNGDGSYLRLDFISPVPEPAEMGVAVALALCLFAIVWRRRQRNRTNEEKVFD